MATPTTPPTLILGPGAGVGAVGSVDVGSDDTSGIVTITSGLTPSVDAIIASLVFNEPFDVPPKKVILTAANNNAAAAANNVWVPVTSLAMTGFDLKDTLAALLTGLTFKWYYSIPPQ